MAVFALYSAVMIYSLLRFGKSKILGIVISIFYLVVMLSLFAAATANFADIAIPSYLM